MHEIALVLLGTVLVNNVLLAQTLGVSALWGMSSRLGGAVGLAAATGALLVLSVAANHIVYRWLLVPLDIQYLALPVFVLVIALIARGLVLGSRRLDARLHHNLNAMQPLLMANAAVLGLTLLNAADTPSLALALLRALSTALGFALVLVLFAGLREQLTAAAVPLPFRGPAIAMLSAGLMALAFMGFVGMA
ncbi:MAG: electron transport complex subunit RsxA [Gammaproteobacteria bacterium]|nr:electron transport complex subunit RsxA [Gammaproteobacteria bacterium]